MSLTSLTHAQAQAKANQIDEHMVNIRRLLQQMQDRTTQMTGSSWKGNQARLFAQRMLQHTDDFAAVVQKLEHYVETGKTNMTALVNLENE